MASPAARYPQRTETVENRRLMTPPRLRPGRSGPAIGIVVVLALVGSGCTKGGPVSLGLKAPPITGWLHTKGTEILNANGRPVRLLSVGIHGMEPGAGSPAAAGGGGGCSGWSPPDPATYAHVAAWGFNSVRLAISWANLEPTPPAVNADGTMGHTYDMAYIQSLDGIIGQFHSRGIAVILDMHQNKWTPAFQRGAGEGQGASCPGSGMPIWLYADSGVSNVTQAKQAFFADQNNVQQGLADAWKFLANRYAPNSAVVGADMFNEPYPGGNVDPTTIGLDHLYQLVGQAIRSANSKMLLIFEDTRDLGNGLFGVNAPPPFDDVVYSYHLYTPEWSPEGERWTNDYLRRAAQWSVPTWIGEFNAFGGGSNSGRDKGNWRESTRQMMAFFKSHGVGWSFWAYAGANSLVVPKTNDPKPDLLPLLQRGF